MGDQCLVVVVDDEPEIREIMQLIIANAGYKVETASNSEGERILSLKNQAQLFLVDLGGPIDSGLDLVRKLDPKSNPYEVIIMKGGIEFDWVREAEDLGVVGYLHKPFSSKKLIHLMKSSLEARAKKAERLLSVCSKNK